jgi:hypothetical protein
MHQAPDPARRGPHIALLEIALNHLENKGPALDEVAEEETAREMAWQDGIVAGFYLDSNLKRC